MIDVMRGRSFVLCAALTLSAGPGCSPPAREALTLERNRLTVHNGSSDEWQNVEIWLNHYFRAPVRAIPAGGSFVVNLDQFVDGYGRRFDYNRMQITDVRVRAQEPGGGKVEVVMPFRKDPLTDALGGKGKS
jgi:hypothetical protein